MEAYLWLFVAYKIIGATCPFTSKAGSILSLAAMIASFIFIVLSFFFASHWWHGLLLIAILLIVPLLTPKINPNDCGHTYKVVSGVMSHLSPVLVLLMYLSLFGIL